MTPHRFDLRVYYEDTDLAGIVYYANYLKFIERGRSEMLRGLGVDQTALQAAGLVFAVRQMAADWLAPARLDDLLSVETTARAVTGARIVLRQEVLRGPVRLFCADLTLAALSPAGRAARIPAELRQKLSHPPQ
jgi:acyl-CoA thioester hydrolase